MPVQNNTFRFIHAADLHLDTPFRGLTFQDPVLAQQLRDASLSALTSLVNEAITRACYFVIIAGDIYDGLHRGIRAQLALKKAATRLHNAGIPLILLHGNHDPLDLGYTAVKSWPPTTTILSATQPQVVELQTPAGRVTITGQSFPQQKVTTSLAANYPSPSGTGLHIAVLHTQLVHGEATNSYSPCTLKDLVHTDFHYWALGHIHTPKIYHPADPLVAYSGNLQGRHFSECGPRGCLLVEGSPKVLTATSLELAPFVFEQVQLRIDDLVDLYEIQSSLIEKSPQSNATLLIQAKLTGRSSLFEALQDAATRDGMLTALNEQSSRDVIWMDLQTDVQPDLPWEVLREQASLSGSVIRHERTPEDAREVLRSVPSIKALARELTDAEIHTLMNRALYRAIEAIHPKEIA